jgi:FkbM family methyltransferase
MRPDQLKAAYLSGAVDKKAYIEQMAAMHEQLFSYSRLLRQSQVAAVRILPDEVRVAIQWPPIELSIPDGEMRVAPVEALNFGAYEPDEFALVESLVRQLPADRPLLIDVGGNVGYYSIGLRTLHPRLRVRAFEPVPATAAQFRNNCLINACTDIELNEIALSDHEGQVTLHVHPACCVAASEVNILESSESVPVVCPRMRLDTFLAGAPDRVDFIKCDVEGGELAVFRGAEGVLRRDQPVVFAEMLRKWSAKFGYHPNDMIAYFASLGYRCHGIANGSARVIEAVDDSTLETNFIFLHKDRHEGLRLHC